MYYHPLMFEWANADRTFHARQLDALRAVAEARDATQFAARLLACADLKAPELAALSTLLAETHRKLGDVVGSRADQVRASLGRDSATALARRQMTA